MIDWMQKHKKYLLVTIWISTIAFIGAGSTGWGDYHISNSSDVVATVGDRDVSYSELNSEYSRLFTSIKQENSSFDEDSAKQMNLQNIAMKNIINRKFLLNFADDIGLISTQDEVLKAIVENKTFFVDDKFSTKNYKSLLKQNNVTPSMFEEQVKEGILIDKVLSIFETSLSPLEETLSDINTKLEDEVKIVVLDSSKIKVSQTPEQLKKFWESTKNRYMTNKKYALDVVEVEFGNTEPSEKELKSYYENNKLKFEDADGKIKPLKDSRKQVIREINKDMAQEKAKRIFYDIKNKKISTKKTIYLDKFSSKAFSQLSNYKTNDYVKPIELKNKYVVGKLSEILQSRVMTYKEAKERVSFFLEDKLKLDKLEKNAQKALKNFKGKNVGFISKENYFEKLEKYNLDRFESNNFVFKLMSSVDKKGYFIIDKKAVVYEIVSQKIPEDLGEAIKLNSLSELNNITQNDDTLLNAKNTIIQNSILQYLENKYQVEYLVNLDAQ